jgi:hypothetical protein
MYIIMAYFVQSELNLNFCRISSILHTCVIFAFAQAGHAYFGVYSSTCPFLSPFTYIPVTSILIGCFGPEC